MCFYNDADWFPSVMEEDSSGLLRGRTCEECWRRLSPGETLHTIDAQECEECYDCDQGYCKCDEDEDGDCEGCQCDPPNFGESYSYRYCDECRKFREAIIEAESDCPAHARQPGYGTMFEEIQEGDDEERYFQLAEKMFPELERSGYLRRVMSSSLRKSLETA